MIVSSIYPPEVWAIESLMVLRDNLEMAGLVFRDFEDEVRQFGDTVHTRKPTKLTVQDFAPNNLTDGAQLTALQVELLQARQISVVLDKHKYTAFIVEDRDEATSIKDLRDEFIIPAIDPIAQQVDDDIMTEYLTGTDVAGGGVAVTSDAGTPLSSPLDEADIIAGRTLLNNQQCPLTPRNLVLSTEHEGDLLGRPLFHQANTAGSTEALRNANLGRAFGFDTFMSQNVPANTDTDAQQQSLAFHPNVLAFVARSLPDIPGGTGAVSSSQVLDNVSMRVTTSYEHLAKGVVISFDVLYGLQLLDANLGVIIRP